MYEHISSNKHRLLTTILLHLLPGVPTILIYTLVAYIFSRLGLPPLLAISITVPVVLMPIQLGLLLYLGKRQSGKWTLKGVVQCPQTTPLWQFILLTLVTVAWAIFIMAVLGPALTAPLKMLYTWLPSWFSAEQAVSKSSPTIWWITWILGLVMTSWIGPFIEELYFRGFLLPRISWLKAWAPLLSAALFSLYHFWSPWQFFARTIAVLPLVAVVYWKKDIRIGIASHILLNTLSSISAFFM